MIGRAAYGLLVMAAAHRVAAQASPEVRLEAGYARVSQQLYGATREQSTSDAALLAVFWRRPTERWTLYTGGNLTYARDSLAAAQAVGAFSVPWRSNEKFRTDVGVAGASFSLRSVGNGGNGNLFGRQHYVRENGGAWIGGAAGLTMRNGRITRSLAADVGAWGRLRFLYASASLSRQNTGDVRLLETSGVIVSPRSSTFELEDWQVVLQARRGPHDLTLSRTTRRGVTGAETDVVALSGSGTLQLTERVAVVASAGRQLSDPLRGLPQADIVTASIRMSLIRKTLPVMQRSAIAEASVEGRSDGGDLEVRVFAADTMLVEIAGDFSGWKPLPVTREGSLWVARVALPSGKFRVGVRVNHGPWRAPRNLARVRDDFGGESGLIVIP